jgi:nucleoid-associated protein YgaU
MHPADHPDPHDITEELARLRGAIATLLPPAPARAEDRLAKSAIAGVALIPTVFGAIAAGATEAPRPAAPPLNESSAKTHDAHVVVPVQRFQVVPLTPEHKPIPGATPGPDFSFHPRFKAMLETDRGLHVSTGRGKPATLYRVAPGDSLYAIARTVLGQGNRWRELYAANRDKLASPSLIRVGMTLKLPHTAPARGHTYHVAEGDSLYIIAAKRLKNGNRWREIAALNKARLKGTTTIHPRQVLLLPTV